MKRVNDTVEALKALSESKHKREEERENAYNEAINKINNRKKDYYSIREATEAKRHAHAKLLEGARNDALASSIKSIYMTAMEPETLTDNALILGENLVDNWIKEKGGAEAVLRECSDKTYLLSRIASIVEEAAQEEVRSVEEADNDSGEDEQKDTSNTLKDEDNKDESEKSNDDSNKKSEKTEEDADTTDNDNEDSDDMDFDDDDELDSDDSEDASTNDDSNSEDSDSDTGDDDLGDVGVDDDESDDSDDDDKDSEDNNDVEVDSDEPDPDEDAMEDDDVNDALGDPIDSEESDDDTDTIDEPGEKPGKLFDDLDQEPDVKKAVNIIHQRVADAEETFIKNNAEDKKKVDQLINKISDNVKTVEDINDKNDTKSKIAQESARMNYRKIESIRENRPLSVFEKMVRELGSGIIKDQVIKEEYIDENGKFDMGSVIESARMMYGFLETLNTIQLEKVDTKYLQNVIESVGK